jgi:hypothetical protein
MTNKKFLVPVLALFAFGLPAGASIATYCSGVGCSPDNNAQFMTDLATDSYTLGSLITFSVSNGSLVGDTYSDNTGTGVVFTSDESYALSFSGTSLATPVEGTGTNYIGITIPDTIAAIEFSVTAQGGLCLDPVGPCPASTSPVSSGFVGFINSNPGGSPTWSVDIGAYAAGHNVEINNFSVALDAQQSPTPEVGTLLLIGAGLIVMRWMKRSPRRFFRTPLPV